MQRCGQKEQQQQQQQQQQEHRQPCALSTGSAVPSNAAMPHGPSKTFDLQLLANHRAYALLCNGTAGGLQKVAGLWGKGLIKGLCSSWVAVCAGSRYSGLPVLSYTVQDS
jgi:hypothetical protein